jgi:hypothetical protein
MISNPVLWFIQHYLCDLAQQPIINDRIHRAWTNGYVEVNKQVAQRVAEVAARLPERPLVLVHDYQLYLVPKLVREQVPGAIIQHFVHLPWPTPQYWKVLPREMRDAILQGLLGCDIVGFQSSGDVRNFLMTCEINGGLAVGERERAVLVDGRVVYVRNYPISIDVAGEEAAGVSSGRRCPPHRSSFAPGGEYGEAARGRGLLLLRETPLCELQPKLDAPPQGLACADPRTSPYITPRASSPINERRTRTNVRAHVSTRPVSLEESDSAGLYIRV